MPPSAGRPAGVVAVPLGCLRAIPEYQLTRSGVYELFKRERPSAWPPAKRRYGTFSIRHPSIPFAGTETRIARPFFFPARRSLSQQKNALSPSVLCLFRFCYSARSINAIAQCDE